MQHGDRSNCMAFFLERAQGVLKRLRATRRRFPTFYLWPAGRTHKTRLAESDYLACSHFAQKRSASAHISPLFSSERPPSVPP